jgi:hypothetical protein
MLEKVKEPLPSVGTVRVKWLFRFTIVTLASGTTAFSWSATIPVSVAVLTCARAAVGVPTRDAESHNRVAAKSHLTCRGNKLCNAIRLLNATLRACGGAFLTFLISITTAQLI